MYALLYLKIYHQNEYSMRSPCQRRLDSNYQLGGMFEAVIVGKEE